MTSIYKDQFEIEQTNGLFNGEKEEESEIIFRQIVNDLLDSEGIDSFMEISKPLLDVLSKLDKNDYPRYQKVLSELGIIEFLLEILGSIDHSEHPESTKTILKLILYLIPINITYSQILENHDDFVPFLFQQINEQSPFAYLSMKIINQMYDSSLRIRQTLMENLSIEAFEAFAIDVKDEYDEEEDDDESDDNAELSLELMKKITAMEDANPDCVVGLIQTSDLIFKDSPSTRYLDVLDFCISTIKHHFLSVQPILELNLPERLFNFIQDEPFEIIKGLTFYAQIASEDIENPEYLPYIKEIFAEADLNSNIIPWITELSKVDYFCSLGYGLLIRLLEIQEVLEIDFTEQIYSTQFIASAFLSMEQCAFKHKSHFLSFFSLLFEKSSPILLWNNREDLIKILKALLESNFADKYLMPLFEMTINFLTKLQLSPLLTIGENQQFVEFIARSEILNDINEIEKNEIIEADEIQGRLEQVKSQLHKILGIDDN